ncbi:LuxR C-terminal-related transcriptional regulator [Fluviicola taffensis]|jgi:DNA-binding CsgD family transcriptional regulator|uniref:Transcriptional regulator, LuxR family n=1 Tax=Fluviicola taffensis (strain DSM 16823 / NCIMB 13979 / RW262) TaxID=755732 RepID=F2IA50_FLUTR|nr:LuxR C-terminal-related transcriptional regulator [Fluviicola taffensis]AEA45227.1 transcriptional regulator, LuxR family [Fluviicola taffensis DSM 16823]
MKKNDLVFYDSAHSIWKKSANNTSKGAVTKRDQIEILKNSIFKVGESYFFTFDVKNGAFTSVSKEIKSILGYDPENISAAFFLNQIHPEDQPYFLKFEAKSSDFYKNLPLDKIDQYKIQYDFRIADSQGNWKRILHQMLILEFDDNKNFVTSLGIHTEISHLKQQGIPILSFIGLNGNPSFYNYDQLEDHSSLEKPDFTKRELEILRLIIASKTSAIISEELFVSIHTVNSHRKNILKKSNCASVTELLVKAISESWI